MSIKKIVLSIIFALPLFLHGQIANEGLILRGWSEKLQLYYFDNNITKFNIVTILKNCEYYKAFPNGTIYCLVKSSDLYKEQTIPEFGIKLILIKQPERIHKWHSHIDVNPAKHEIYYTGYDQPKDTGKINLYKLKYKTGQETKLSSDHNFHFAGYPALSPDNKKIAFYCAIKRQFLTQVAYYDLETKETRVIVPPSLPISRHGPDMGTSPVWNQDSSEIFFTANYPQKNISGPNNEKVYKVNIENKKMQSIGFGFGPLPYNNEVTGTIATEDKQSGGIWRISPLPKKLLYSKAVYGRISPSGKYIAYHYDNGFYVSQINSHQRILLKKFVGLHDCAWISIKPNSAILNQKKWSLTEPQAVSIATKYFKRKYDKSFSPPVDFRDNIYTIYFKSSVVRNPENKINSNHFSGYVKLDAASGKILEVKYYK